MMKAPTRGPGWDKAAVNDIAAKHYGGLQEMFDHYGWSTDGYVISQIASSKVVQTYGSVAAFVDAHENGIPNHSQNGFDPWSGDYTVMLTSFWGWKPETWGTVGFTLPGRRDSVVRETTDPFIMVVYVTKNAVDAPELTRGRVTGFYLVSHIAGHRDEFTTEGHHGLNPEKWVYSLKAIKAYEFLPEFRPEIDEFDPTLAPRARSVAASGEVIQPALIEKLRHIPYVEVPVFGGEPVRDPEITYPGKGSDDNGRNKVRAGPARRMGYVVPGEPVDTPKELYVLELCGDVSAYLGRPANGQRIYKIGLSLSPQTRLEAFRKAMPRGAFTWTAARTTREDGHEPYPTFEAAECGESAMKDHLAKTGHHLGGEFYAATPDEIAKAWAKGRSAALGYKQRGKR